MCWNIQENICRVEACGVYCAAVRGKGGNVLLCLCDPLKCDQGGGGFTTKYQCLFTDKNQIFYRLHIL